MRVYVCTCLSSTRVVAKQRRVVHERKAMVERMAVKLQAFYRMIRVGGWVGR
jgi:hypothetical protein